MKIRTIYSSKTYLWTELLYFNEKKSSCNIKKLLLLVNSISPC